jgi:hypothetical protein
MANLRTLTGSIAASAATNYPTEVLIYNLNVETANNGGICCLYTVPVGTKYIKFEMWGGGGGGAGACCCQQGAPGGSGAYAVKTVCSANLGGCQYTICAGGTTSTSPNCIGCPGCDSYVNGFGLSNFCARGGAYGDTHCFYAFCYSCCIPYTLCCCAYGGDICVPGNQSTFQIYNWCQAAFQQHAMLAASTASGPMFGPGGCINGSPNGSCTNWFTKAYYPGGGGMSANTIGGNCWCGGQGASGLVSVTYG